MAEAPAQRDVLAQVMADGRKTLVPLLAELLRRDGIETVESKEERRLFWQRALTPEQEQALWMQEMATRGVTELTPETAAQIGLGISKQVYPARWDMLAADGRDHESDQIRWAYKHAQKGPPEAETDSMGMGEDE